MTRKVSLWIVIALVGSLAAMTVAVAGLAAHDQRDGERHQARRPPEPGRTPGTAGRTTASCQ